MKYSTETCAAKKAQEKKLYVTEMRLLTWTGMCGVTKIDIRNAIIGAETKVGEI